MPATTACVDRSLVQLDLRFGHGTASVRFRVVFFGTSIVGDALDDFFRVVTAGEGALRIGPVMFGLAQWARLRRSWRLRMVTRPEITLDRLGAEPEILEMIDALRVLLRLHPKLGVVLPVQKAR